MEILGIGPLELLLIALLALIILGPRDLQQAGRKAGRWLYKLSRSEFWTRARQVSNLLRSQPRDLMEQAALDDWRPEQTSPSIRPPESQTDPSALVESWVADPRPPVPAPPHDRASPLPPESSE
ncbi:MAG: twin-arginine translocase TatA/TatE family subunit [Anaerolineales bacterium]